MLFCDYMRWVLHALACELQLQIPLFFLASGLVPHLQHGGTGAL